MSRYVLELALPGVPIVSGRMSVVGVRRSLLKLGITDATAKGNCGVWSLAPA